MCFVNHTNRLREKWPLFSVLSERERCLCDLKVTREPSSALYNDDQTTSSHTHTHGPRYHNIFNLHHNNILSGQCSDSQTVIPYRFYYQLTGIDWRVESGEWRHNKKIENTELSRPWFMIPTSLSFTFPFYLSFSVPLPLTSPFLSVSLPLSFLNLSHSSCPPVLEKSDCNQCSRAWTPVSI